MRQAVGECCCGSVGLKTFEKGPGQTREQFVDEWIGVDTLLDHVGLDQGEVGDRRGDAVRGEFHAQSAAELLDGCLAHGVGNGAHSVEKREDRTDQDELAAVSDDFVHRRLNGVDNAADVDREHGLN